MAGDRASYGQGFLLVVFASDGIINNHYTSDQPNDKRDQPRRSQPFILGKFEIFVTRFCVMYRMCSTESSCFCLYVFRGEKYNTRQQMFTVTFVSWILIPAIGI